MTDLTDNQFALKEAVAVACTAKMSDPAEIVSLARAFQDFLVFPGSNPTAAPVVAPAAPQELGAMPLVNGVPEPAPVEPAADPAPADPAPVHPDAAPSTTPGTEGVEAPAPVGPPMAEGSTDMTAGVTVEPQA